MVQQSRGEFFPRFQFEPETAEKFRLVLAVAMRSRKQVMCDFRPGTTARSTFGNFIFTLLICLPCGKFAREGCQRQSAFIGGSIQRSKTFSVEHFARSGQDGS
jgi:hypothetical protein